MNCKLCGTQLGYFGKVKVDDGCICKACHKSMTDGTSRWGEGIPNYKRENKMSDESIRKLALDTLYARVFTGDGIELLDDSTLSGDTPYITLMKDGHKEYVILNVVTGPDEALPLPYDARRRLLEKAEADNAGCYYADILVRPNDPARLERGLYLKNDDYTVTIQGPVRVRVKVSDDWIRDALEQIDMLDPERDLLFEGSALGAPKSGGKVQFCLNKDLRVKKEYDKFKERKLPSTFQQKLLDLISEKGMTNPEFYNRALMDRKLFSAIKKNPTYRPKKETAVACCFGLGLTLEEAQKLLRAAGYTLSLSIPWDRIVYFCLEQEITDLDVVNELLYVEKQKCIGVIE